MDVDRNLFDDPDSFEEDADEPVYQYTKQNKPQAFPIFAFGEAIIACTTFVLFMFHGKNFCIVYHSNALFLSKL